MISYSAKKKAYGNKTEDRKEFLFHCEIRRNMLKNDFTSGKQA